MTPLLAAITPPRGLAKLRAIHRMDVNVSLACSRPLLVFLPRRKLNFLPGSILWYTPDEALDSATPAADIGILPSYWRRSPNDPTLAQRHHSQDGVAEKRPRNLVPWL